MSALRVERDGALLRIAMARPGAPERVRRRADRGADRRVRRVGRRARRAADRRRPVVLRRRRRRVDARLGRAELRGERRRRAAPPRDARCDRRLSRPGRRPRAGARARRRLRPRRRAATSSSPSRGAQFAFSEVKLGIVPAVISPFALAKIGPSAARRYFVTGERFSADVALRIGLVHEVAEDLDGAVDRVLGGAPLGRAGSRPRGEGSSRAPRSRRRRRPSGSPRTARAPRARRACGRSSRSAPPLDRPVTAGRSAAPCARGRARTGSDPSRVSGGRAGRSKRRGTEPPWSNRGTVRHGAATVPTARASGQTPALADRSPRVAEVTGRPARCGSARRGLAGALATGCVTADAYAAPPGTATR